MIVNNNSGDWQGIKIIMSEKKNMFFKLIYLNFPEVFLQICWEILLLLWTLDGIKYGNDD